MMDVMKRIRERASEKKKHIIFPESSDPRVLRAAAFLSNKGICSASLVGDPQQIRQIAGQHDLELPENVVVHNKSASEYREELIDHIHERRKHKGINRKEAEVLLDDPLIFAGAMVTKGRADGCVAGSVATTGEVIKAAIYTIGLKADTSIVSSIFLMAMPDGRVFTYGDCGVVPYPDAEQLADIAVESSRTHKLLTEQEPVTALLSFSTKGSAEHEKTALVTDALARARQKEPGLTIDGELQFDAAFVPEVARRKAPDSPVAGKANVFVFPNLDAGNIAYKITERLAGATATGPILQGLAKPMMDLSRGCSWQDIVNAACVAVLMGEK